MPVLSKLPAGSGSGEPGISNGQGILKLNIFTQMDEPATKDGIWVQTNHQYERVMVNQPTVSNYKSGVWSFVSTPPCDLKGGSAVAYNGEIHIFNGTSDGHHYKWDGTTWINCGILGIGGLLHTVVYNGELCLVGIYNGGDASEGNACNDIYKWNGGNSWTKLTTNNNENSSFSVQDAVVYNNKIYVIGEHYDSYKDKSTYKLLWWDGSVWCDYNQGIDIPNNSDRSGIIVYNGKLHAIGAGPSNAYHYKLNGSAWILVSALPFSYISNVDPVIYNGQLNIIVGTEDHLSWNGSTWNKVSTLPYMYYCTDSDIVVYNGNLHMLGRAGSENKHYQFQVPSIIYSPGTLIIKKSNTNNGAYLTNIADTSVIQDDGTGAYRFPSGFDDVFYFADTAFDWDAPMYYGNGSQWIKFKN